LTSASDIKPDNILHTPDRTVAKLSDFASARSPAPAGLPLTPGCGTLWYRPPELLLGDPSYGAPLHAADAWAAGLVLLEMANLRPAFPADTELGVLLAAFNALGTPGPPAWPAAAALPRFQPASSRGPTAPASEMLRPEVAATMGLGHGWFVDAVDRLILLDPSRRAPAAAVLAILARADNGHADNDRSCPCGPESPALPRGPESPAPGQNRQHGAGAGAGDAGTVPASPATDTEAAGDPHNEPILEWGSGASGRLFGPTRLAYPEAALARASCLRRNARGR
jgi:serine/threonine protein kinase